MRTNTAIVFAWVVFLAAFATGCTGDVRASGESDKDQARLEIKGNPGGEFSGSCAIGDEESEKLGGKVPKSFTYDLEGRSLACEIGSDGDLRVELTVGENAHSVQSISGGTLNLAYEHGSISSVTSSSSSSGRQESSYSSQVTSSTGKNGQGPANVTEQSRNVSGFEEVELRGIGNLYIEQTGSESLTVAAQEDVLPKLGTEVVNNRLIIGPKPDATIHTTEPINYKLTVKDLNALEVSGSANVEANGISNDRLAVTISGAGNVKTGGEAGKQEINVSGSGHYGAEDLESKEVKIAVLGAGSAIVNVSEKLDAQISGIGSVEYTGDPTVKQDVSGVGRVSKH
jgi:putative autotransporter adhesin-like protein